MNTTFLVTKHIAKTIEILNYLPHIEAYQLRVDWQRNDEITSNTIYIPQQFLIPYSVEKKKKDIHEQSVIADPPQQEKPMLESIQISNRLQQHEQPPIFRANQEKQVEKRKELDFDKFSLLQSTKHSLDALKRQVLVVRVRKNRKKLKV